MIQAARSGKQNIVEGCAASPTSAKTEIRLISVAKASLQELLEDFKDYLSTHNHRQWEMDSKEMAAMRRIGKEHTDANFFMEIAKTRPPETIANMACLTEEVGELARVIARTYGDQSFKKGEKPNLGEEMADVLWVLICLANQTGVDLTEELQKSFDKKTKRDAERHKNNPKLSEHQEDKEQDNKN